MSETSQGPGWWQASDGKWYAPQQTPAPPPTFNYPPPYAPPPYSRPAKTNGLAIASLVCGILWGFGILSVLALIFGLVSKKKIKVSREGGNGLATAGLVLGIVGIVGTISLFGLVIAFRDEIAAIDKPATVFVQPSTSDGCYRIELESSDRNIDGSSERDCGPMSFDLGTGLGRKATVMNESGSGSVTVVVTIEGKQRDRAVAGPFATVNVRP